MFFLLGAFEFVVVGVIQSGLNDYLWTTYILLSLLPPITVAYYIYRYHPFQLVIKGSLVYAAFAVIFIAVYTYGVRRIGEMVGGGSRAGAVEAILILAMFALAGPLVRVMDKTVERLFAREIGLYRDVVRQISVGAAGFGDIGSLVRYAEQTIQRGLDLARVRIVILDPAQTDGPEHRLSEKMSQRDVDVLDSDDDLVALSGTAAYALRREGRLIGLMIVAAEQRSLTSEKHAVLEVLAGQVAIEIESCRLVEEKLRLERELAIRERLAILGQMAATVAHEVKNPLSSIKSIAQVMKEDQALSDYEADLSLIIGEVDRLNRTVSQLLAFSRPGRGHAAASPVSLKELVDSTVALVASDAEERSVEIKVTIGQEILLPGDRAAALREALSNLVINAIHASPLGSTVAVRVEMEKGGGDASTLLLSVTDNGAGISEEMRARVFEPFYTTKPRGTGLGLAIVQRRVAELGGAVELVSPVSDGHGTRFCIRVPQERLAIQESVAEEVKPVAPIV
jgi:signal transduction histidine kinase